MFVVVGDIEFLHMKRNFLAWERNELGKMGPDFLDTPISSLTHTHTREREREST